MIGRKITAEVDPTVAAEAFANGLKASLTSGGGVLGGNIAKTMQVVMYTDSGIVQIASCADGNVVDIYQVGADVATRTIKTRAFLSTGEVHLETGLENGSVIISSKGVYGASGGLGAGGNNVTPMPLGLEGFAGKQFFVYPHRNAGLNDGLVPVANGAVASDVELLNGAGDTVIDSLSLPAFGHGFLGTEGIQEYQIVATQPIFAGIITNMDVTPTFFDARLAFPMDASATNIIGQNRNMTLSALYDNTEVWWYRQNGEIGKLTVSPGSPINLYTGTHNELGVIFSLDSNTTPATSGTFTLTINAEVTSAIPYNATASQILTALDGLTTYSSADFKVEMTLGNNLGEASAQVTIYTMGLLGRVTSGETIDTALLVGNVHTLNVIQAYSLAPNAGSNSRFAVGGLINLEGSGPLSAFSGADGSGFEAVPFYPASACTQCIPIAFATINSGHGAISCFAIQSLYEGNYKIFGSDGDLKYTGTIDRGFTADSGKRQKHPAQALLEGSSMFEPFLGGWIEADVPINLIMNTDENQDYITGGIDTESDEILLVGVTPDNTRAELRKDAKGLTRRRTLSDTGTETWELT